MKIMMLSDLYPPFQGGIERHVQSLSRELSERKHRVVVCTIGRRDLPEYEQEGAIKVYRLEGLFQKMPFVFKDPARKWHPPAPDRQIRKRLAQIIEKENPDIIHAHGWMVYSVLSLKRDLEIPLVYTIHDYRLFCPKMFMVRGNAVCDHPSLGNCIGCVRQNYGVLRALFAYYGVRVGRKRLRYIDAFIAVSDFVKETYKEHLGLGNAQITAIPNFYDPASNDALTKGRDFPDDFILYVGWLMPHKGVDVLIRAYRQLSTKTKLLIVGIEHPDYNYQSTKNVEVVRNAPHSAVMEAMSQCRFAVFPSVCPESAGTVVLEAMSKSRAVIASNVGGLTEIVVDGETGILVAPNNVEKLSDAISYLLKNPDVATRMGERGYRRFIANYTPSAVVPKIIGVYQKLTGGCDA